MKGQISYCHKLTLGQVAEKIQEVAELKEDYDVLKDIKGVDLLAKEFQVHDICKREYLRFYSSNTSTYRNGNENTAMNSEGSDFEALKKCLREKVLDLNQPLSMAYVHQMYSDGHAGDTRYRNKLKTRILEEFPNKFHFLTIDGRHLKISGAKKA